jgi:hypothetical protein
MAARTSTLACSMVVRSDSNDFNRSSAAGHVVLFQVSASRAPMKCFGVRVKDQIVPTSAAAQNVRTSERQLLPQHASTKDRDTPLDTNGLHR